MQKPSYFLLASISLLGLFGCVAGPVYEGEALKNFDGSVFVNSDPLTQKPFDMLALGFGMVTKAERWPKWVENPSASSLKTDPTSSKSLPTTVLSERVTDGLVVTYINHATTLIQLDGLNILTDPIYAERASPFSWAGPKRVRAPGVALADLTPIDVILISHNHYDHLDVDTLKTIHDQQQTPPRILAGLGNGALFKEIGMRDYLDMQWDQTDNYKGAAITFVECRHRSGRGISDQMKTLWGSFVIESASGSVYFAGDTGYGPHLKAHGEQYGPFDLSILPIGAYEPRWFMADVHMNPEEAAQAHLDLLSERSLSIHFGVFQLTYEAIDAPVKELTIALKDKQIDQGAFLTLEPGQSTHIK